MKKRCERGADNSAAGRIKVVRAAAASVASSVTEWHLAHCSLTAQAGTCSCTAQDSGDVSKTHNRTVQSIFPLKNHCHEPYM